MKSSSSHSMYSLLFSSVMFQLISCIRGSSCLQCDHSVINLLNWSQSVPEKMQNKDLCVRSWVAAAAICGRRICELDPFANRINDILNHFIAWNEPLKRDLSHFLETQLKRTQWWQKCFYENRDWSYWPLLWSDQPRAPYLLPRTSYLGSLHEDVLPKFLLDQCWQTMEDSVWCFLDGARRSRENPGLLVLK